MTVISTSSMAISLFCYYFYFFFFPSRSSLQCRSVPIHVVTTTATARQRDTSERIFLCIDIVSPPPRSLSLSVRRSGVRPRLPSSPSVRNPHSGPNSRSRRPVAVSEVLSLPPLSPRPNYYALHPSRLSRPAPLRTPQVAAAPRKMFLLSSYKRPERNLYTRVSAARKLAAPPRCIHKLGVFCISRIDERT